MSRRGKLKRLHSHKVRRHVPFHRRRHFIKLDLWLAIDAKSRPAFFNSDFDLKMFSNPQMDAVQAIDSRLKGQQWSSATKVKDLFAQLLDFEGLLTDVRSDLSARYKVNYPQPVEYLATTLWPKTMGDVSTTVGSSLQPLAA